MINIEDIDPKGEHPSYHFPTIDFKFQNTGNATAFLWQFAITLLKAEINAAPNLRCIVSIRDRALIISVENSGWGDANACQFQFSEPFLDQLFPPQALTSTITTIPSGQTREVLCLTKEQADPKQSKRLFASDKTVSLTDYWASSRNFWLGQPDGLYQGVQPAQGLFLGKLSVIWRCTNQQARTPEGYRGNILCEISHRFEHIFFTQEGFYQLNMPWSIRYAPMTSSTLYTVMIGPTMIDPTRGVQELCYPCSRKIAPGDVERFHILIGAKMSCTLLLKFRFFIDQGTIIESEDFEIEIWNPRGSGWDRRYVDGAEVTRDQAAKIRWRKSYSQPLESALEHWRNGCCEFCGDIPPHYRSFQMGSGGICPRCIELFHDALQQRDTLDTSSYKPSECCFICGEQTQRLITGRYFHYICERCVNALYALLQRQ
jgi:hypothetical protein